MLRTDLIAILDLVKPGLSSKEVVPILSNFAFDGQTVTAWNTKIGVRMPLLTEFDGCARGAMIIDWLAASRKKEIEIYKDESEVVFKGGTQRLRLPVEDFASFPEVKLDLKDKPSIDFDNVFMDAMEACLISADKIPDSDNACVQLCVDDQVLMYSTDAETISKYVVLDTHSFDLGAEFERVFLPIDFCKHVKKVADAVEKNPVLYVADDLLIAAFNDDEFVFAAQMQPDNTYDLEDIIEKSTGGLAELDFVPKPKGFESALKQQLVVLGDSSDFGTDLSINGNKLTMETVASYAEVRTPLRLSEEHSEIDVVVNPAYFLRVMTGTSVSIASMSILENCSVFTDGTGFYHLVSNIQAAK